MSLCMKEKKRHVSNTTNYLLTESAVLRENLRPKSCRIGPATKR